MFAAGRLAAVELPSHEHVVAMHSQFHSWWGFLYPATFQFIIPAGSGELSAQERYGSGNAWNDITAKTASDAYKDLSSEGIWVR